MGFPNGLSLFGCVNGRAPLTDARSWSTIGLPDFCGEVREGMEGVLTASCELCGIPAVTLINYFNVLVLAALTRFEDVAL